MIFIEEMLKDCTYIKEIKYSPNDPYFKNMIEEDLKQKKVKSSAKFEETEDNKKQNREKDFLICNHEDKVVWKDYLL